ncbi:peptidase S8/S53 domain-containing protein [Chaetomium tenue]|uniref:Peptidase S8/S53 domain-containing protein n=1 Tax=Chaetomium tenue TaxID=1854479 RepID=A0ACB7PC00_9PEZI|nr:peptidase S8/S53 domain-containing protein [Chaetomium globosum]
MPYELPLEAKRCLQRFVFDKPELLGMKDHRKVIPILQGANELPAFIFMIFDLVIPEQTRERLKAPTGGGRPCERCPLQEVSPGLRSFFPAKEQNWVGENDVNDLPSSAPTDDQEGQRMDGNDQDAKLDKPCLHDQIDVELMLEREEAFTKGLAEVVKPEDRAKLVLEYLLDTNRFDDGQDNHQLVEFPSFESILRLCPQSIFTEATFNGGMTLLQHAALAFGGRRLNYPLVFEVIEALVRRSPASIFTRTKTEDGKPTNVYHVLGNLETVTSTWENDGTLLPQEWISKARDLIKRECIGYNGSLDDDPYLKDDDPTSKTMRARKISLLYNEENSERKLCFNLGSKSNVIIDQEYIDVIKDNSGTDVQLETIQEFVRLPNWKPEGGKRYQPKGEQDAIAETMTPLTETLDPYISIFDWLRDTCGVEKIFSLEVDDVSDEPHTNVGIREALRGISPDKPEGTRDFEIGVWKWKKFDICVETIAESAPGVHEVHLYSSGNVAVLRGWSCRSGLAQLKGLREVHVEIHAKNTKDHDDCVRYWETFKARVRKHCPRLGPDDIKMHDGRKGGSGQEGGTTTVKGADQGANSTRPKQQEWIKELLGFKGWIQSLIPDKKKKPRVKVGILDDGADLANLNGTQRGWSFRADQQEYFMGSCEHGTQMATCVRDICPMAELYIGRLDDAREHEPNQKFTVASCTKALRWALSQGADVISMSWTYSKSPHDSHKGDFEALISETVQKERAALFGSLPDMGHNHPADKFAPVGLDGVMKISSSTPSGAVSESNLLEKSDFLLPGEETRDADGNLTLKGSSYATAYAAGLAALVLYTFRTLEVLGGGPGSTSADADLAREALLVAKKPNGMRRIFEAMALGERGKDSVVGPFVQPSAVVLRAPEHRVPGSDLAKLRDIVNTLVTRAVRTEVLGQR